MKLFKAIEFGIKYTIMLFAIIFISYVIGKNVDKFLGKYNLSKVLHNILFIMFLIILIILFTYILKPIYFNIF